MNATPWGTVVLGFVWLFPVSAQQSGSNVSAQDPTNAICAEKIEIPSFPLLARQARLSSTLSVNVKLGTNGVVDEVSAQSHLNNDRAQAVLHAGARQTRVEERPATTPCQTTPLAAGAIKPSCSCGASCACDRKFSSYRLFGWAEQKNFDAYLTG